jgi:hypothetical protein
MLTAEERAGLLANWMARHIIGENFAAESEACRKCVAQAATAIRAAETDARNAALEEAAREAEAYTFMAKAIRSLKTTEPTS